MEKALTIILADGSELVFEPGTRVNFSREQLRVSIDTPERAVGVHTDRFAAMVKQQLQPPGKPAQSETGPVCAIELGLNGLDGTLHSIEIPWFETVSVDAANNLLTFRGTDPWRLSTLIA